MKRLILLGFASALGGLLFVTDAFAAITCRSNTTGARSCSNSTTCPSGWSKISSTCSKTTVGGNITYISHHGQVIKCTWEEFQGDWAADPTVMSVSHSVEGANNYATCSAWPSDTPVNQLPPAVNHSGAPFGFGQFFFNVTYQSGTAQTCIEDANAGIGNNCTKTSDAQNPKHNKGGSSVPGASLACLNNFPGTTLTYQFACADGVSVTGFLALVPTIDGNPQAAPEFTGPCSADRVAAGKCTMMLGGIPSKTVKVKGQSVAVFDDAACLAAFPGPVPVVNALNSSQTQTLDPNEILFYQEVASEGSCDPTTKLPTVAGLPAAAYGRYCQSDLGLFSDNGPGNIFSADPPSPREGFDNELRVCPAGHKGTGPHTASHDVEQVALTGGAKLEPQGPLNLNCSTGGNTDSARYTVKIPDQAPLFVIDIDISPLSDAPKLEGVAPTSADLVVENGVRKLQLKYPTCNSPEGGVSGAVIANNPPLKNNQNLILHLQGQTKDVGLGPVLFQGEFTIKVNGL